MGAESIMQHEDEYAQIQFIYNLIWSDKDNHYGLWEKGTKKLSSALQNTNRAVCEALNLSPGDRVLDAGCGMGGTSLYAARQYQTLVEGICLSATQINQAIKNAKKAGLSGNTNFTIQDFTRTSFPDNYFSGIMAVESVVHAPEKINFCKEAFRVLKKGGSIAVIDVSKKEKILTDKEQEQYDVFLSGWDVPNLITPQSFIDCLKEAGFHNVQYQDKSDQILKSSARIHRLGVAMYPFAWLLQKTGLVTEKGFNHSLAAINQKKVFFEGMVGYGMFTAEK